jgi:hypothetical protein
MAEARQIEKASVQLYQAYQTHFGVQKGTSHVRSCSIVLWSAPLGVHFLSI